jgi:serine protease
MTAGGTRAVIVVAALTASLLAAPARAGADEPAPAGAGAFVPGEVVVGLAGGGQRVLELPPGVAVGEAIGTLRDRPRVTYANPNWVARAALDPFDRGDSGEPHGWRADQWNFLGAPGGVRVPKAWNRAIAAGAAGGDGVTIAVVDTGVAYTGPPPDGFAISPDFVPEQFVPGRDFVDGDSWPVDENGHGTHVAGTIGERVTLGAPAPEDDFLTGLAYGARLMPVRVLDANGAGGSADVAAGILWAAHNGADVINVSLQLPSQVRRCNQVRSVCRATRKAKRLGALVVAAAGNSLAGTGRPRALFPAQAPGVLSVGAATEHGCLAAYSNYGKGLDLLAPGGGSERGVAARRRCKADSESVRQVSFDCFPGGLCSNGYDAFGIRSEIGTSMAAAHASGVAALVEASGVLGAEPSSKRLRKRLRCTARNHPPPRYYGAGLLDATRATDPRRRCGS